MNFLFLKVLTRISCPHLVRCMLQHLMLEMSWGNLVFFCCLSNFLNVSFVLCVFGILVVLQLCEDSVDFRRPIFTAPLADCEFHEYSINTSWTAGASLPMTPLFSNTQLHSGPASMEPSQGGLSSLPGSERNNTDDVTVSKQQQLPSGMIRATMTPSLSLAFTQSQGGGGGGFSSTQEGATGSSALFAMSQRSVTTDYTQSVVQEGKTPLDSSTNLRRRILHPAAAHSQVKVQPCTW